MTRKRKPGWPKDLHGVTTRFSRLGVQSGGPVCDFCCSTEFRWRYRTNPFVLPEGDGMPQYVDDGEWAGCDECKDDLATGDFDRMDARLFLNQMKDLRPGETLGTDTLRWTHRLRKAFLASVIEGPLPDG